MQFLKKHYEKIVLGVVLLGVAATSLLLTMRAGDERQKLAEQLQQKVGGKQKPLKPVELAGNELKAGDTAPAYTGLLGLSAVTLADTPAKARLFSVVPSLDTGVCSLQTKNSIRRTSRRLGVRCSGWRVVPTRALHFRYACLGNAYV